MIEMLVVARAAKHYRDMRGVPAPAKHITSVRQFVSKQLADPNAYHSYTVRNGTMTGFVQAWQQHQAGADLVILHPWIIPEENTTPTAVSDELK